jgi:hypothetical protein
MDNNILYTFKNVLQVGFNSHFIQVPQYLIDKINLKGRIRVNGEINGFKFNLAIQKTKEDLYYFYIGKKLVKDAKLIIDLEYEVSFTLADINELELPEVLEMLLEQDEAYKIAWNKFSIGLKRSFCVHISGTKNIDSQIKRATDILDKAIKGELYSQRKKQNK